MVIRIRDHSKPPPPQDSYNKLRRLRARRRQAVVSRFPVGAKARWPRRCRSGALGRSQVPSACAVDDKKVLPVPLLRLLPRSCPIGCFSSVTGTLSLSPRRDSGQQLLLVWKIKINDGGEPGPQTLSRLALSGGPLPPPSIPQPSTALQFPPLPHTTTDVGTDVGVGAAAGADEGTAMGAAEGIAVGTVAGLVQALATASKEYPPPPPGGKR